MSQSKLGPHLERLAAVAAASSGKRVAIGGARGDKDAADFPSLATKVWLYDTKAKMIAFASVPVAVSALAFADHRLLVGDAAGNLRAFDGDDLADGPVVSGLHEGGVLGLAVSPDGTIVASVGRDARLRLFDASSLSATHEAVVGIDSRCIAVDPVLGWVAVGDGDGTIRALRLDAPQALREMQVGGGECGGVTALAFTEDGRVIAGCGDGSVRFLHLEGEPDEELRSGDFGHESAITGLLMGPQLQDENKRPIPRRMISCSLDGSLKSWPTENKRRPRTLELGSGSLLGSAHLPASGKAKPERAGGTVAVIDDKRRLNLVALSQALEFDDSFVRIESEFVRLRQDLNARKVEVREAALRRASELVEDEARRLLDQGLTEDGKSPVRRLAAELVGATGRRRSRVALRRALNDSDKKVRFAALASLVTLETDAPLSPLRAALRSKPADMRKEAVARLPQLRAESPLVPGLITSALSDSESKVRMEALGSLCELEDKGSIGPIRTALAKGPPDVRAAALRRLIDGDGRVAPTEEGREVLEGALDDEDAAVRHDAFVLAVASQPRLASKLSQLDPSFAKSLTKVLDAKAASRLPALSVGDGVAEAELEPLFGAIACHHPDTAFRGARVLGLLADSRATGFLLQLSREADASVRRSVVEGLTDSSLAMPSDQRLVARLEWLLDDADKTVRAAAFESLLLLADPQGDRGTLDFARLALGCANQDMRVRALQLLVEFGGGGKRSGDAQLAAQADAALGDALDDEDASVRAEAFRTLWAWNAKTPQAALERGSTSRHPDIRDKVVREFDRLKEDWATERLREMVGDSNADVGLAAYAALTKSEKNKARAKAGKKDNAVHLAALGSIRPQVRVAGCKGSQDSSAGDKAERGAELRKRLIELVEDENPQVHTAAIEALDKLLPKDQQAFSLAFSSKFLNLRVRAAELCGKRRDERAIEPMRKLLRLPASDINRPSDELRQRAARAVADVGAFSAMRFYEELLDDDDGLVREMGARGLAAAGRPGEEQPLLNALGHGDLAVRSWAAEGLSRLGDARAVPVLSGTLRHEHRPIRMGAILSLVTLGPDGVRGILQGLDDSDREIQDLVFAVIVARDVALARAGHTPDLLLSALSSAHPEIRFAAARTLERRGDAGGEAVHGLAQDLVGPRRPDRASDMKKWPDADERNALLNVVIGALASDDPGQRYAAVRVLALRSQPEAYWRESKRLRGPSAEGGASPFTSWDDESLQPRKRGWIRSLFTRASGKPPGSGTERALQVLKYAGGPNPRAVPPLEAHTGLSDPELARLVFGTYAGLVRQAPAPGHSDETHRIRRDSIGRLAVLAGTDEGLSVGRDAAVPILRRALSDPHHLVRKAGMAALGELYGEQSLVPLALALESDAADIGRQALDQLVARAESDDQARTQALEAVDAANREVRAYAVTSIQRLFEKGSLEPWLVALESRFADVRLTVVDRLVDANDERVEVALQKAMESDHEDLRLKAAVALSRRGSTRTLDVLSGFLRQEDFKQVAKVHAALVSLAHARSLDEDARTTAAAAAAKVVAGRMEDDPDKTADRNALIKTLARIGSEAGDPILLEFLRGDDVALAKTAFGALVQIARDPAALPEEKGAIKRTRYREALALRYLQAAAVSEDVELRTQVTALARDVDDPAAQTLLETLAKDRDESVRVAATESLVFRAEYLEGASIEPLARLLREGRRELVLPAAWGLASRARPESFQALMLVFKAGESQERERAVLGLGRLADRRALEELYVLVDETAEIPDEDRALAGHAAEALGNTLAPPAANGGPSEPLTDEDRTTVREIVERLARQGDQSLRTHAIAGLRRAGDDRSRAVLEGIAADQLDYSNLRRWAIEQVGELQNPDSESVMGHLLNDAEASLRKAARDALGKIFPDDRTRVSFLALASSHTDMSEWAATYLAQKGDPDSLVSQLASIEQAGVRARLRRGLVRRGACPVDAVRSLLASDKAGPRSEGAWLAGAKRETSLADDVVKAATATAKQWRHAFDAGKRGADLQPLNQALRATLWAAATTSGDVSKLARAELPGADLPVGSRELLVRALGTHGTDKDSTLLAELLSDPTARVRAAAAAALAAVAPKKAAKTLLDLSAADPASLGTAVEAAIAEGLPELLKTAAGRSLAMRVLVGQHNASPLVEAALRGKGSGVREAAIVALGREAGADGETALQSILDNKDEAEDIRKLAFKSMRRLQRRMARRERIEEQNPA